MDDIPPGIRRLCLAVAADGIADRQPAGQQALRERVSAALLDACGSAGLDRVLVWAQHTDDTEVALLPVGVNEPRVIASLIAALAEALHRINTGQDEGTRVRLRMAVHEGITILTSEGFTGQAVAKVSRLAGAQSLRAALAADPVADLVVMLSDQVFEDVTQFGHDDMSRDRFRRAEVTIPASGDSDAGWIYAPGHAGQ